MKAAKSSTSSILLLLLILGVAALVATGVGTHTVAVAYSPHQGDHFSYYESQDLGSGIGNYAAYTEHMDINGTEHMNAVGPNGTVSANYSYSWSWSNSTGTKEKGKQSGDYTFSSTSFLYLNGTDHQNGYVNPSVWFAMNNSLKDGGTFNLLNTQMTVMSTNYSYYLPSQNRYVSAIFAQGSSSYLRNDVYGKFNATYTWSAYFDPSTGYIIGYGYVEQDTNSAGDGFTYTENLYMTASSYALATASPPSTTTTTNSGGSIPVPVNSPDFLTQYAPYIVVSVVVIAMIGILGYALSRTRRTTLPRHSEQPYSPPPHIDLKPNQPEQIVIREVAKVNCRYCGTLIDSTADACPHCGGPRT